MYYFSYLSAVFYYKYFVCKHYFEAQAGYLLEKLSFGVHVYTAIFPTGINMASP
jgi:hypothetical protein